MSEGTEGKKGAGELTGKEPMGILFNRIARRYDLLNRVLSFGIDQHWRRIMLRKLKSRSEERHADTYTVLDLATGTGDVVIGIRKRIPNAGVTGADLSLEMMKIGEEKVRRKGLNGVRFVPADAADLPFGENSFDAVTIAFGIRNFSQLDQALKEIRRVLKPGGTLLVLEFAWPRSKAVSALYSAYSKVIIPVAGQILAGDRAAYRYLTSSIRRFPNGEAITGRMAGVGLTDCSYRPLGAGIVHLYEGRKTEA
ncbi:MAG: bifunctional demethylmenaquinone methyltransferase/2-methoxy-6-polyprenyl-1,4-benzoquinol methylase UbiE [Bacteroidota bacterium]